MRTFVPATRPILAALVVSLAGANIGAAKFTSGTPCAVDQQGAWETTVAGCRQVGANLEWSGSYATPVSAPTFAEARAYCDAKTDGGFDDWRLPNAAEMQSAAAAGSGAHLNLLPYAPSPGPGPGDFHWWSGDLPSTKWTYTVSLYDGHTMRTNISGKVAGRLTYSQMPGICVR